MDLFSPIYCPDDGGCNNGNLGVFEVSTAPVRNEKQLLYGGR